MASCKPPVVKGKTPQVASILKDGQYLTSTKWGAMKWRNKWGQPFDLLLGRKTYEIFASYWPHHDSPINQAKKYVVSNSAINTDWEETIQIRGDVVAEIENLKQQDGPMLQVHGSSNLIQTLLANDLADQLWLKVFPVTLGKGKRLFGEGTIPAAFTLTDSKISSSGVIIASYRREGEVKLGSF